MAWAGRRGGSGDGPRVFFLFFPSAGTCATLRGSEAAVGSGSVCQPAESAARCAFVFLVSFFLGMWGRVCGAGGVAARGWRGSVCAPKLRRVGAAGRDRVAQRERQRTGFWQTAWLGHADGDTRHAAMRSARGTNVRRGATLTAVCRPAAALMANKCLSGSARQAIPACWFCNLP